MMEQAAASSVATGRKIGRSPQLSLILIGWNGIDTGEQLLGRPMQFGNSQHLSQAGGQ
jgi:hypothetical protein